MGDLVNLNEYKENLLEQEIIELRKELKLIMESLPEVEQEGYYLSLEEMRQIEAIWLEERRKS
jgi:hypothetical protein